MRVVRAALVGEGVPVFAVVDLDEDAFSARAQAAPKGFVGPLEHGDAHASNAFGGISEEGSRPAFQEFGV